MGLRKGTRSILSKPARRRGLPPMGCYIRKYQLGQKVGILIDPSIHKGMPHPKFHGQVGKIVQIRGRAYLVELQDGSKFKRLFVRPEHLKPV